jgi:hypothetical protein
METTLFITGLGISALFAFAWVVTGMGRISGEAMDEILKDKLNGK